MNSVPIVPPHPRGRCQAQLTLLFATLEGALVTGNWELALLLLVSLPDALRWCRRYV